MYDTLLMEIPRDQGRREALDAPNPTIGCNLRLALSLSPLLVIAGSIVPSLRPRQFFGVLRTAMFTGSFSMSGFDISSEGFE